MMPTEKSEVGEFERYFSSESSASSLSISSAWDISGSKTEIYYTVIFCYNLGNISYLILNINIIFYIRT